LSPLVWAKAGHVTPLWLPPEMRHAANNSPTPSPSFRVTKSENRRCWLTSHATAVRQDAVA